MQGFYPLGTWKGSWHPLCNSGRSPRYSSPLKRNTEFHAPSQEEPRILPPQIEMRVDSHPSSRKESPRFCRTSRGGWSHLEIRAHPGELCLNSKRPGFPHLLQISLIPLHWFHWNPEYRLKTWREVWQHCGPWRNSPISLCQLDWKPDTPRRNRSSKSPHETRPDSPFETP